MHVLRLAALLLGAQLAGCGLISSDVTDFNLALQDKRFTINADSWQLDGTAADAYTKQTCQSSAMCEQAVAQVCQMGCSAACSARHTCDLTLDVSLAQTIDLITEHPELKSVNDQPLIKVSVDSVTYEITTNTLSVQTPTITVYVAPSSVTSTAGLDSAQAIGMIDAVDAGVTTSGARPLTFTPAGKKALADIMGTFKTPFNVLVGSQITVTAGQPLPTGKLDAVVHITGHAGI